jgi:hypothetical protein
LTAPSAFYKRGYVFFDNAPGIQALFPEQSVHQKKHHMLALPSMEAASVMTGLASFCFISKAKFFQ